jgi:hypothetical protein
MVAYAELMQNFCETYAPSFRCFPTWSVACWAFALRLCMLIYLIWVFLFTPQFADERMQFLQHYGRSYSPSYRKVACWNFIIG